MVKCYLISKASHWPQEDGEDGREEMSRSSNRNVKNSKDYVQMSEWSFCKENIKEEEKKESERKKRRKRGKDERGKGGREEGKK